MCSYLVRRGATYYFRRSIPTDVRDAFNGRSEWVVSLRTKDRPAAKRMVPHHLVDSERLFDEVRQSVGSRCPLERPKASTKTASVSSIAQTGDASHRSVAHPDTSDTVMLDKAVVDGWAAERKVQQKGVDAHRAVARWFYNRVGRKPVDAINRRDVLSFKAALIEEGQSLGNVRVKLSRLRTLLQWASDNELARANVAAGVTIKDADKAANKRLPFDLGSLNRIFSSPIYQNGERPVKGRGEAAYWLPLLALFTGARMEELGQLRASDVTAIDYPDDDGAMRSAWFISITADDEDGLRLKNARSERLVPVHSILEKYGFIALVKSSRRNGNDRLFDKLKPNVYGRLTAKWGE